MRVMVIVKANRESEAGEMPSTELLALMTKYNEELMKAGVIVAAEGLKPTSAAKRVLFEDGEPKVVDGPFPLSRDLIAGFWIWQVKSMDEALTWARRMPVDKNIAQGIDLRPVFETEDFGEELTPELRKREEKMRQQLQERH